ncbi:type VI secretion system Vgr family protein [Vannielia litorea]|uniref:Type VI secretion system secreted protein VgrG n=1 Tax=Vannielia litorea TaxID=1217970 RepID=A0A1N6IG51_9RHOB|nr:type VI secretion system tip protein TssI/VgrG [Vannielia litorea]SIO31012.1 type VI secretion system secreted protein VgrG [Vannielia litorea]
MDGALTQDHNVGRIETVLGKDHLLLVSLEGTERVSDLFCYSVAVRAPRGLETDALMGTHATVMLATLGHDEVAFDGVVTEIEWKRLGDAGDEYALTLRPWFWLAGLRRQQRIFHEQSVDEILEEVLGAWSGAGAQTHRLDLAQSYPKLEYTVQYGESDLAFACRMMERFGISFHFRHEAGNHCMVLTDSHEAMDELPGRSREYRDTGTFIRKDAEHFWEWREARGMTTGKVRLTDYNFKTPVANLLTEQVGDAAHAHGEIESYDYPGVYPDAEAGRGVVGLRTTQERAGDLRTHAAGDVKSLKAGMRCVADGPNAAFTEGEAHLCLEARHSYTSELYRSAGAGADSAQAEYKGSYLLTPVSAPWAPPRKTAQPRIHGPQTARVVGEGEIDCDEYGRILVRFHWDLADAYSMRCRVSQSWAGKGWGGMVIPRIGMEVVVEFLEGDPDKPLVTGCVYNGKNEVPYELPKHKTRSTFRTDTHQGKGYNEVRFEDKDAEEEIFIHAEKDVNEKTLHNHTTRTDNNQVLSVGHVFVQEVEYAKQTFVGGNYSIRIGSEDSDGPVSPGLRWNDQGIGVYGYRIGERGSRMKPKGNYSVRTEGNQFFEAKNNIVVSSEKSITINSDEDMSINVSDGLEISTTDSFSEAVGGKKFVRAADAIHFVCGRSSFSLKKSGEIVLRGTKVAIHGSEAMELRAGTLRGLVKNFIKFVAKRIDLN